MCVFFIRKAFILVALTTGVSGLSILGLHKKQREGHLERVRCSGCCGARDVR